MAFDLTDFLLTKKQLESVSEDAFTDTPRSLHSHEIEAHFLKLAEENRDKNDILFKLFCFISVAFSFSLSKLSTNISYEPKFIKGHMRSPLPEDFSGELLNYLNEIAIKIPNPFIYSRLFDIVWINNKKSKESAKMALTGYAQMIELVTNSIRDKDNSFEKDDVIFLSSYIERALQLFSMAHGRKKVLDGELRKNLLGLYELLEHERIFEGFDSVTKFIYSNVSSYDSIELAKNAELMANENQGVVYFDAVRALFNTAGFIYKKNEMLDDFKRCQISAAMITVSIKDTSDNALFKTSWIRSAIKELKSIGGMGDLIDNLKAELKELREETHGYMTTISVPFDIADEVEKNHSLFLEMSLPEIISSVVRYTPLEKIDKIRDEAKEHAQKYIFGNLFGSDFLDESGRKVAVSKPLSASEDINDEAAKTHHLTYMGIDHQFYVYAIFEPARQVIYEKFTLTAKTFESIVINSPFIPESLKEVFFLGFYKLWQGDYISACYLLLPNMESCIRNLYELSGKDTTRLLVGGLEEGTSLSILLSKALEDLEMIFSKDIILTIELLFLHKAGPSFRHRIAHGNLHSNWCHDSAAIFSCCLTFYLCCVPLLGKLDELMKKNV